MEDEEVHNFLERIISERKKLREDLLGLPRDVSGCKVGDFGCGWGYLTWCLMLEIPNSECIGIDKFDSDDPPDLGSYLKGEKFSVDTVRIQVEEVIKFVKSDINGQTGNGILGDIWRDIIEEKREPIFQQGDFVKGDKLIVRFNSYFDFIYSKRVLYNIYSDESNQPSGDVGVNKAIINIANSLKTGGWFCFVEIETLGQSSNLDNILKQAGFVFGSPRHVNRLYKTPLGDFDNHPYLIYQCKKI